MQDDESVISAIRRVPLSFSSLYCVFYPHRSLVKARPNLTVHGSATVALYSLVSVSTHPRLAASCRMLTDGLM